MSEIKKVRMQQKRDTTQNWKNSGFVPLPGEVIIYNDYQKDNSLEQISTPPRIKVGDGASSVDQLGAITGEVYVQNKEPENAGEGAVWLDPDTPNLDPSLGAQADWDSAQESAGYINNKPIKIEKKRIDNLKNTKTSMASGEIFKASEVFYDFENINGPTIYLNIENDYKLLPNRFGNLADVQLAIEEDMNLYPEITYRVVICNGAMFGYSFSTTVIVLAYITEEGTLINEILGIINDMDIVKDSILTPGVYFLGTEKGIFITNLDFVYSFSTIREEYKNFFKAQKAVNIYSVGSFEDWYNLIGEASAENIAIIKDALFAEITKYQKGDVILIPTIILSLLQQQTNNEV